MLGLYRDGNHRPRWHFLEVADMGLHEEAVLNVHEALFGPIEAPSSDDANGVLAYRVQAKACRDCVFLACCAGDPLRGRLYRRRNRRNIAIICRKVRRVSGSLGGYGQRVGFS